MFNKTSRYILSTTSIWSLLIAIYLFMYLTTISEYNNFSFDCINDRVPFLNQWRETMMIIISFRITCPLWSLFLGKRIWANIYLPALIFQRRFLLTSFLSFVYFNWRERYRRPYRIYPFTSVQKIKSYSVRLVIYIILFLSNYFRYSTCNLLATKNKKLNITFTLCTK